MKTKIDARLIRNAYILLGTVVLLVFGWKAAMILNGITLGACLFAALSYDGKKPKDY